MRAGRPSLYDYENLCRRCHQKFETTLSWTFSVCGHVYCTQCVSDIKITEIGLNCEVCPYIGSDPRVIFDGNTLIEREYN